MSVNFGIRQNLNFEPQTVEGNLNSSSVNQDLIEKTKNVVAESAHFSETESETDYEIELEAVANEFEGEVQEAGDDSVENKNKLNRKGNLVKNSSQSNTEFKIYYCCLNRSCFAKRNQYTSNKMLVLEGGREVNEGSLGRRVQSLSAFSKHMLNDHNTDVKDDFSEYTYKIQIFDRHQLSRKRSKESLVDRINVQAQFNLETSYFCLKAECCPIEMDVMQDDGSYKNLTMGKKFTSKMGLKYHLEKQHNDCNPIQFSKYLKTIKYPKDQVFVFSRFTIDPKRQRTQE